MLELVTAPIEEPISREEAKAHLRLDTAVAELAPQVTLVYQAFAAPANGTGVARTGYKATAFVRIGTIASGVTVTAKLQHSTDNVVYDNVNTTDTWTNVTADTDVTTFDETNDNTGYRQEYTGTRPYVRVALTAVSGASAILGSEIILQTLVTNENALIDGWISAARQMCETYTKRALVTQVWDWKLCEFPANWSESNADIKLPLPPLQSVAIRYRATAGSTTYSTLGSSVFTVSTPSRVKGRMRLAYNQSWPTTADMQDAVSIQLTCGYGAASAVPESLKAGMLLVIGHLFSQREYVNIGNIVNELPALKSLWNTGRYSL